MTGEQDLQHESDCRIVSMFLWQHGKFKQFLQLIKSGKKNGYNSYFEAAMEIPLEQKIPLWQTYLNKTEERRSEILRLPPSTILQDESTFQKFSQTYGIRVEQSAKLNQIKPELSRPNQQAGDAVIGLR